MCLPQTLPLLAFVSSHLKRPWCPGVWRPECFVLLSAVRSGRDERPTYNDKNEAGLMPTWPLEKT